ncbi:MAG: SGNH/GDSL hydrolase family protein, partial [Clostridia bacterium]|nr:SGNH/GDSL hydrolase family protein [Clostridia bacterium]
MMLQLDRVAFVGNSLTLHPPKTDIGWTGNWGMAASAMEKDYVHILMNRFLKENPTAEFMVKNVFVYEQKFWEGDLSIAEELRAFRPTLIVLAIGDNVAQDEAKKHDFRKYYEMLIDYIDPEGQASVVCTSCFFPKPTVDRAIWETAKKRNLVFADFGSVSVDAKNKARGLFWHAGVA